MTANELRKKYIEFFISKGHKEISGKSLIPENDPTVLFNTAGMQPLVPYLLGEKHPLGTRLTDVQKCVRTGDIDDVGDPSHLTFFEMMGNWSLGDYFKEEAISWSWEFLTSPQWLGIDPPETLDHGL
jgi:alanyl-tRNA synthetase